MAKKGDKTKNRAAVVLLIQGDSDHLELTKKCLLLQGDMVIETASSAIEAFQKMAITKPDVIVCDLSFPLGDGFDFLRRLREDGDDTPLISFAYNDEKDLVLKSLDLGADGFVFKSSNTAAVFEELRNLIVSLVHDLRLLCKCSSADQNSEVDSKSQTTKKDVIQSQ